MPKKKQLKSIPTFDNTVQEQEFWSSHDATDDVGWSQAERVAQELRPQP